MGGGQICPLRIKKAISLEPNVGLTSNQAVNSSFLLCRGLFKEMTNFGYLGALEGLFHLQSLKISLTGSLWVFMKV